MQAHNALNSFNEQITKNKIRGRGTEYIKIHDVYICVCVRIRKQGEVFSLNKTIVRRFVISHIEHFQSYFAPLTCIVSVLKSSASIGFWFEYRVFFVPDLNLR